MVLVNLFSDLKVVFLPSNSLHENEIVFLRDLDGKLLEVGDINKLKPLYIVIRWIFNSRVFDRNIKPCLSCSCDDGGAEVSTIGFVGIDISRRALRTVRE